MRAPALALLAALAALPAAAEEGVRVRVGDHPGHGRIVFDWPAAPSYRVEQAGDRVTLRFPEAARVALPARLPRNMRAIRREGDAIEITVAPGARIRHFRSGARVALDAMDAPAAPRVTEARRPAPPPAALPAPAPAPMASAAPEKAPAPPPHVDAPPPPPPIQAVAPPVAAPDPLALRPIPGPASGPPGLRLPRAGALGAALLARGDRLLLVLDAERPFDLSRLAGHPHWPLPEARRLGDGAALILPLPPGLAPVLRREAGDLHLGFVPEREAPPAELARLSLEEGKAVVGAAAPGGVVLLRDPLTELPLLVGTLREGTLRQPIPRRLPEFEMLESFAGLALLARSDRLTLRAGAGRFVAALEGGALAAAAEAPARLLEAAAMTRFLDLPDQPIPALLERLRGEQAEVAQTPPLSRGVARLAAAQTLLALGLPQEAASMLRLAAGDTPEAGRNPRHAAIAGIAALLAGGEGEGLEAELPPSDELSLWRALRAARRGDPRAAAPALAATVPLLLSYPEPLRRRIIAPAAEALALGGEGAAARRLLEGAGEDASLALAQALLDEAEGQVDRALEGFEAASQGRDRRARARALRHAAERRLATGRLDAAGAAQALESALFAWRGDDEELALRRRIAELRREAGDPRGAMAMLREAESAFPEAAQSLRAPMQAAFLDALRRDPPAQAVALHDAHPTLVPPGPQGEAALTDLAERLLALDLPERATALLRQAVERQPLGESRAALGARLAQLQLAEGEPAAALAALAASGAGALSPALAERRALLAARAEARRGRRDLATEALEALGPAGDEARAEILAEARDFAGAAAALSRHLAALTPAEGPLPEAAERVALRVAALLALAGDERGIAALRRSHGSRIRTASLARGFEALTADPVRGLADLPRLARELNLFRGFPDLRERLRTAALPTG